METAKPGKTIATRRPQAFSLVPTNLGEAMKYAELMAKTDLVPKDFKGKPENVLIAVQMGAEVGLSPIQSIQNIAVINGRPTMWGDAVLALVQDSDKMEWIKENDDGETATCTVKRRGYPDPAVRTFSNDDARKAGLDKKAGTWQTYKKRMRQMRARAFALRDNFADVLKGLAIREEVEDYVETIRVGPTEKPLVNMPEALPAPTDTGKDPAKDQGAPARSDDRKPPGWKAPPDPEPTVPGMEKSDVFPEPGTGHDATD